MNLKHTIQQTLRRSYHEGSGWPRLLPLTRWQRFKRWLFRAK